MHSIFLHNSIDYRPKRQTNPPCLYNSLAAYYICIAIFDDVGNELLKRLFCGFRALWNHRRIETIQKRNEGNYIWQAGHIERTKHCKALHNSSVQACGLQYNSCSSFGPRFDGTFEWERVAIEDISEIGFESLHWSMETVRYLITASVYSGTMGISFPSESFFRPMLKTDKMEATESQSCEVVYTISAMNHSYY